MKTWISRNPPRNANIAIATIYDNDGDAPVADVFDAESVPLMLAAPQLLEALKLCVDFCKGHQETPEKVARYRKVCAAIARAEGKG
jgi:hypothetical protein